MRRVATPTPTVLPRVGRTLTTRHLVRTVLLLIAVFLAAALSLRGIDGASLVPAIWPAAGVAAGLHLTSPVRLRRPVLTAVFVLVLAAYLVQGFDPVLSLGFSLTCLASVWALRRLLVRGLDGRRVALLDQGDVSRMIGSIAVASLVAAAGCGLTDLVTGHGNPLLGALAAFGGYAASLMILLPLFLKALDFEPLAGTRERAIQSVITVGTTVLVFLPSHLPIIVFAVMPMFAWHAFRGSQREATLLLTLVALIGTTLTILGIGPIHALGVRYDVAPEVVSAVLQLFLLDCGLILLPLSVMVTQQRMAAARADAERVTLQRLVSAATGTAIIATGRDGRIELFNPGAEDMLGYAAEEVIGAMPDRFHPEAELARQASFLRALPHFADICRASVQCGDTQRVWRFVRKDGQQRSMRMTLTALTDELGELRGYLATAEDVTEREAAHAALLSTLEHQRTAVDRLRELERVKADFVATVSHELRTPITSIIGYTEVLEDGMVGDLTEPQQEIVGRVVRNGKRLLLLVEDLLTLSQIESSSMHIEPVSSDIRTVVTSAREALTPALNGRSLSVRLDLPDVPVVHDSDPVALRRMLLHLMTNAVKFTPDGGTVTVSLEPDDAASRLVVSDSGIGIPEEEQARLFTRFFRSKGAYDDAVQGVGLGLTIVQSIVALHGGRIEVSSAPQDGTTVTVTLPRVALAVVPEHEAVVAG